ncbi:ribbon-helix-helix protein, CopG family [Patulibacter defluvii]|uniref:ribbon-helix-helix protein, CopG family n=1 Tax=Patulibacter defluvii TaxID=3095358 RepID=UPI002A75B2FD|nr:ribbon-helix-helix protein, CopG family [Patulibacter sp. DM4]
MKVLISMPEDLLLRVDDAARERGLSRSAFLQQAAAAALGDRDEAARTAATWVAGRFAGIDAAPAADLVRRDRDAR